MVQWPNDSGLDTHYEEHEPVELTVRGNIPTYAAGVLYRTGPLGYKTKREDGTTYAAKHWFDGFAAVHRFQIDFHDSQGPAKVHYRSRRIVDKYLELAQRTGTMNSITFASKRDPCQSFFKKVMSIFQPAEDIQNVGVTFSINMPEEKEKMPKETTTTGISGQSNGIETLQVRTDAAMFKTIDPETLEPLGIADQRVLHPELTGDMSGAHGKSDTKTGDFFNYNLKLGYKSEYRVFRTSATTGKTEILATFTGKPAYIHSLFLTENYVVLCVWNSHITWGGISVLYHKNILDAIAPFNPKTKAKWYVVDRKHGRGVVATYESDPFFSFHSVNAWEEPNPTDPTKTDIITELSLYENLDVVHRFHYDNIMSSSTTNEQYMGKKRLSCLPMQTQFRLASVESSTGTVTRPVELLFQAQKFDSMELATINPAYLTRRHRYTYGCADRLKSSFMDGIAKFDNITQTSIFWETDGHTPGEPIFVADPQGTAEDGGVLLTVVLDGYAEKSYLLVLSAKDLTEVGRAEMAGPMSFGFHGTHKAIGRAYGGDI